MSDTSARRRHPAAGAKDEAVPRETGVKVKVERSARQTAWEWLKAIAWALGVALLIRQFLFQAFRIPTGSMKDTLLVHDFLFVNKFIYGAETPDRLVIPFLNKTLAESVPQLKLPAIRQPRQGDIIVFEFPQDRNQDYIKRCVAVAGDTVLVRDGILRVNGEVYESNFADHDGDHSCVPDWRDRGRCPEPHSRLDPVSLPRGPFNKNYGPRVISAGHIFMMGDNRYNSQDSRYWGELPLDHVRGKAEIIYWSYENTFFIPRFERLLKIIDLDPDRRWLQPVVRILALLLIIGGSVWSWYRGRE
jgi:signal peptidase I